MTLVLMCADGYRSDDLVYEWDRERPVIVEENVELSQYMLVNTSTEHFPKYVRGVGKYGLFQTNSPSARSNSAIFTQTYEEMQVYVAVPILAKTDSSFDKKQIQFYNFPYSICKT